MRGIVWNVPSPATPMAMDAETRHLRDGLRHRNQSCHKESNMGLVRAGVAGLAAWKWGGGIIGTILVFLLVYWLLGVLF